MAEHYVGRWRKKVENKKDGFFFFLISKFCSETQIGIQRWQSTWRWAFHQVRQPGSTQTQNRCAETPPTGCTWINQHSAPPWCFNNLCTFPKFWRDLRCGYELKSSRSCSELVMLFLVPCISYRRSEYIPDGLVLSNRAGLWQGQRPS